jgi:hypothetical protein
LYYTDVRRSLGAVDDEKGIKWRAVLGGNYAEHELIPAVRGDVDFGWDLPLKHSSVWLRTTAGIADGPRSSPYANFFFGGFGNNYVDSGGEKTIRENYAPGALPRVLRVPGLRINGSAAAASAGRCSVEPSAVLLSRRHAGIPPAVAAARGVRLGAVDRPR